MDFSRRAVIFTAACLAAVPALADEPAPPFRRAEIGDGIALTYVERGAGEPVVFVHGSLSDLSYWKDQVEAFSATRRAITYSRRYDWPNNNPARPGYSAVTDAHDLARLIETLKLGRAHVVGHSYGAFTALFLATERPDLVRTLTLAEPPAVTLLRHIEGPDAARGRAMYADIERRMVAPMHAAFDKGDTEEGVAIFIDYVLGPHAWGRFSPQAKADTLKDAGEWKVTMTTGTLFPPIEPSRIRAIRTPTLLLSGARSYPFLNLIDAELTRLIAGSRRIIFPDAGHQMWLQHPVECREAVLKLQAQA